MLGSTLLLLLSFFVGVYSWGNIVLLAGTVCLLVIGLTGISLVRKISNRTLLLSGCYLFSTAGLELGGGLLTWLIFGPTSLYIALPLFGGGLLTLMIKTIS